MATLGSLYFSEVRHMQPCELCWYQRIAIFPLTLFLGIATFKDDLRVIPYLLPLALFGLIVAGYQFLIQELPSLHNIEVCGKGPSCSQKIYIGFKGLTISMLSFMNFLAITVLLFRSWIYKVKEFA